MIPIPKRMREDIADDPFMQSCIYNRPDAPNHDCSGRIEWEHAIIWAGKRVNEKWAIVPCCTSHNRGSGMVKDFNRYIALSRATEEDFDKYPKNDWRQVLKYLRGKYEPNN